MYGDHLEQLILSGQFFNGSSRSSSPQRSPSPDGARWPADDKDAALFDSELAAQNGDSHSHGEEGESIGMGPGRTGVKGVIRDRDEAAARDRDRRARDAADLARRMEKASLGGKTFLEEERERQWEQALLEGAGALREAKGRFGHLREVGMRGFVPAVEEDGGVWVVVHIYAPSLERCDTLDDSLVRLARAHPETKFIRCRASAIGFATTPSSASHRSARKPTSNFLSTSSRIVEDEEDPYGDDAENGGDEEDLEDEEDEDAVDTDVLPTMLVYQGGELVHNWVRVDWEAGAPGVEDLLERHHVIQPRRMGTGNFGASLDDEEELRFNSDPDDF